MSCARYKKNNKNKLFLFFLYLLKVNMPVFCGVIWCMFVINS